ncbi:tyrosine-type recombinase/integrase [Candidatus Bipolaricaulota bacterium]
MVKQRTTFDEAIRSFAVYCRAKGLKERTQQTYTYALSQLRGHLEGGEGLIPLPSRYDLRSFSGSMLERGLSRGTIRVRMRSVRVFANFLEREGLVEVSPMTGVEIPRVPQSMPKILTSQEIQKLLRAAKSGTWYGIRNHAMLATFLDSGLRLSELINLNVSDVDLHSQSILVRNGKGSKDRQVYIGRTLARSLRRWAEARPYGHAANAYFSTRDGRRLDKRNVARIIERIAVRARLGDRRIHPHLLRHTFATHFIKNGGDPFSLQRLLGHSDIKTTMIYVNLAGVDLEEAHAKASPVDRLSASR